jgi:hypothetical protein
MKNKSHRKKMKKRINREGKIPHMINDQTLPTLTQLKKEGSLKIE